MKKHIRLSHAFCQRDGGSTLVAVSNVRQDGYAPYFFFFLPFFSGLAAAGAGASFAALSLASSALAIAVRSQPFDTSTFGKSFFNSAIPASVTLVCQM